MFSITVPDLCFVKKKKKKDLQQNMDNVQILLNS